jgi:hypothetical protein
MRKILYFFWGIILGIILVFSYFLSLSFLTRLSYELWPAEAIPQEKLVETFFLPVLTRDTVSNELHERAYSHKNTRRRLEEGLETLVVPESAVYIKFTSRSDDLRELPIPLLTGTFHYKAEFIKDDVLEVHYRNSVPWFSRYLVKNGNLESVSVKSATLKCQAFAFLLNLGLFWAILEARRRYKRRKAALRPAANEQGEGAG